MSNRELVGSALEQLRDGLRPFVERTMSGAWGHGWVAEKQRRDDERFGGGKRGYGLDDPRFLLRVVTEEREIFKPVLPRPGLHLASEARRLGNEYAHSFSADAFDDATTRKGLDDVAHLLELCGSYAQAQVVRGLLGRVRDTPGAQAAPPRPQGAAPPFAPAPGGDSGSPRNRDDRAPRRRSSFTPRRRGFRLPGGKKAGCAVGCVAVPVLLLAGVVGVGNLLSDLTEKSRQPEKVGSYQDVRLTSGHYLSFNDEPGRVRSLKGDRTPTQDLFLQGGYLRTSANGSIALLPEGGKGGFEACRDATAEKAGRLAVGRAAGRLACVRISGRFVALLEVDGRADRARATLDLTLWTPPS